MQQQAMKHHTALLVRVDHFNISIVLFFSRSFHARKIVALR